MGSAGAGVIKKLIGENARIIRAVLCCAVLLLHLHLNEHCHFIPELTSEYADTRKQFNKSLAEFGMIQVHIVMSLCDWVNG